MRVEDSPSSIQQSGPAARKLPDRAALPAHTPGPWKVQGPDNAVVGTRDGLPECVGQIFNVVHGRRFVDEWSPVSSANARLIAAAPKMRRMIEHLLGLLDTMPDSGRPLPVFMLDAMDDARALLARTDKET